MTDAETIADVAAELARERWGDSFQRPTRAPAAGSMPDLDAVDEARARAGELVEGQ